MTKAAQMSSFLKGCFIFSAGFVASQLLNMKLSDFPSSLSTRSVSIVEKFSSVPYEESALSTKSSMTSPHFRGASIGNEIDNDKGRSSKFQRPINAFVPTMPEKQQTMFDRMVQQTYYRTILSDNAEGFRARTSFNITYWEQESKMTTTGGLQTLDRVLLASAYGSARSVFEYGLGESTFLANHMNVPRYAGIDSDPLWVTMVRARVSPVFRFSLADIGETRGWGHPKFPSLAKNIWDYQLQPLVGEQQPFDVYMVDGRWRMGCMLASFLHASARGAKWNETTVLLHDCKGDRKREMYDQADDLLDLVQHSGARLCMYKRKESTTDEHLWDLWNKISIQVK